MGKTVSFRAQQGVGIITINNPPVNALSQQVCYEMLMALKPEDINRSLDGMQALSRNGLRYPFPQYGIQMDVREGMSASY